MQPKSGSGWPFEERSRRFSAMLHTEVDANLEADDCVMLPVSTQLEAHALAQWVQELPRDKKPWIVILFISDRWNRAGRDEYERQIAEFQTLKAAISCLKPEDANRLIFCTLTNGLAAELGTLLGTKLDVVPIPLPYDGPVPCDSPKPFPHLPQVAILGGMRREKGSHLVPEIVASCRTIVPVEFLIHLATDTLSTAEAAILAQVAQQPHVTVIREPMSQHEYNTAINSTDLALFPYEIIPYRKRISGVFGEAVACGKPVVAPRGTWLAEQIEAGKAAGTIFEELQPESIARAVARCVADLHALTHSAQALAIEWRKKEGIPGFVDFMETQIARRSALQTIAASGNPLA